MRRSIAIALLVVLISGPLASADLGQAPRDQQLDLICDDVDACYLDHFQGGDPSISQQVSTASPLAPVSVTLEFPMTSQDQWALLPERLTMLEIALRADLPQTGSYRPETVVRLVLGTDVTEWTLAQDAVPVQGTPDPFLIEDEPLTFVADRVLEPGDQVLLTLQFTIDRPGTWVLDLFGSSSIEIAIPWSIHAEDVDLDEPSSASEPRALEEVEDLHSGALVSGETDCWSFQLGPHELFLVEFRWFEVPIELEQPQQDAELRTAEGGVMDADEVVRRLDDGTLRAEQRWRGLDSGGYTLCIHGMDGRMQTYMWLARQALEAGAPTSPDAFAGISAWAGDVVDLGDPRLRVELDRVSRGPAVVLGALGCTIAILGASVLQFRPGTLPIRAIGMVMVVGAGVMQPMAILVQEAGDAEAWTLEEVLQARVDQIWDVTNPMTPQSTHDRHFASTMGMLDGERLHLGLSVDAAIPLEDGRWRLTSPDLVDVDLSRLVFSKVAEYPDVDPAHRASFILEAGRILIIDLLLLEASMVVDELPESGVVIMDWTMRDADPVGSRYAPTWGTAPEGVSAGSWQRFQSALFPDALTVMLCDCDVDLLNFELIQNPSLRAQDVPQGLVEPQAFAPIPAPTGVAALGMIALGASLIPRRDP